MPRDSRVVTGIRRAAHRVEAYLQAAERDLGVKQPEAHALSYLARHDGCSVAELCRAFGVRPSTMTSILDRLVDRGLIRRELRQDDRRSFNVVLTARGGALARRALASVSTLEQRVADEVTRRDLEGFHSVVTAVERNTGRAQEE